jgi:hypothetical protein
VLPTVIQYLIGPWTARLFWLPAAVAAAFLFKPLWFLILPVGLLILLMAVKRRREPEKPN